MIEFEEACELVFKNVNQLGTEERLIEDSVGWALAQDIVSQINVAPFRNSAMDGFAVKSAWLKGCSADSPRVMTIGATSYAGDSASERDAVKQALKIMTGARVPDGFDAVVPFEDTEYGEDEVRFYKSAAPGQNVRQPGEDIVCGQKLYAKGTVLGRLDIGTLAAIGLRSVLTFRKPSIVIIGTGDELIDPGEALTGDKIYDANTFTVLSLAAPFCGITERLCRVPDREDDLLRVLNSYHDVIVTCGGVSAGERDLVVKIAESCGWQRAFHKVRIKPGKPIYFAVRGKQVLFGLPGNPLSTAVTCCVFLLPALKKMAGFADYRLRSKRAIMAAENVRLSNRKLIWPGFIKEEAGATTARFSAKKSSAALTALLETDGLIIQNGAGEDSGDVIVEVIGWSQILQ
jgi:molybdopterin molybdotransferase